MSNWTVVWIIIVVLGVIASNIMLLKYSARFKFPTPSKPQNKAEEVPEQRTSDAAISEESD